MSSRELTVDAVVIGSGPAGSSAARLLALWGHSVTLLSRPAPRPAVAESLPPSSFKLLDRIGVREVIERAAFPRSTGNSVKWDDGETPRVELFPDKSCGLQVRRDLLDRLLLREAARAGATIRRAGVRDVIPEEGGDMSRVGFGTAGGSAIVRARWVLDCSGRARLSSRHDRPAPNATPRTLALICTWERTAWPITDASHTLVESYDEGWAWSVPLSRRRRQIAVMLDPPRGRSRESLGQRYHAELAKTNWLRDVSAGARTVSGPWARDASAYIARSIGEQRLLRVGDAASFVDPLSSYGIKKALASAWLAAVVTHTCLTSPALTEAALGHYSACERRMYVALQRRFAEMSRAPAHAYGTEFWEHRAAFASAAPSAELSREPVVAALRELKARPSHRFRLAAPVRQVERPLVRGNRLVLEPHLAAPALDEEIRYLKNVDVVRLVALAPQYDEVPSLFEAYNRATPPASRVPLTDFLGVLSTLVGARVLDLA